MLEIELKSMEKSAHPGAGSTALQDKDPGVKERHPAFGDKSPERRSWFASWRRRVFPSLQIVPGSSGSGEVIYRSHIQITTYKIISCTAKDTFTLIKIAHPYPDSPHQAKQPIPSR
jgi:hypothetical protein